MFRTALLVIAGAAAFAAPASERDRSDDAKLEKMLSGLTPGPPQSCINPSRSESGGNFGNTVVIKGQNGILYRTSFRGGCSAGPSDSLISRRPTTQLCSGDIIEIRDIQMNAFRGACSYEEFVPYRKAR